MTSILKIVGVVIVVGVLCVGAVALATDFVWGCPGPLCGTSWTGEGAWAQGSDYPDDANDNASITSAGNLINYDPGSALTINNMELSGASPTKRKLHIKDAALTVDGVATLGDYAELDVDQDLTIDDTDMSGDIWIDVANSTTADLGVVDVLGSSVTPSPITCIVHLVDNTSGTLTTSTLTIDAEAGNTGRGLKLDGSGSTVEVTDTLTVKSKQASDTKRAKLWISAGTVNIDDGVGGTNGVLVVDGGDASSRKAELDIDGTLTAEETQFKSGYAGVDVASGQTATGGDIVFESGAIVTKTGPGTFRSGS